MTRVYLGDSVYVEVERGRLKLTTENGCGPSNTIYLEAEVCAQLVAYMEEIYMEPIIRAARKARKARP